MQQTYPILEFDPSPEAMIEPSRTVRRHDDMPEHGVLCFFTEVIDKVCGGAQPVAYFATETIRTPIYAVELLGRRVAVAHPHVGAPVAVGVEEHLIAHGVRKLIAVGSSGSLMRDLTVGHAIIPTSAVRDEGTSYHYLPPSREVAPDPNAVAAVRRTLERHNLPYIEGKTWTTDAIYRETPAKIALRRDEGCVCVEMEAAAFFAVAQFRGVSFGQLLYSGDDLSGEVWDHRDYLNGAVTPREKLFWLAVEACLEL